MAEQHEDGKPVEIHIPIRFNSHELAKAVLQATPAILREYGATSDPIGIRPMTKEERETLRRDLEDIPGRVTIFDEGGLQRVERFRWWLLVGVGLLACVVGSAIGAMLARWFPC